MRCQFIAISLSLISLLLFSSAKATHIYGGELQYTHLQGTNYEVTLTLYGDCSGENFARLRSSTPGVNVYRGNNIYDSLFLREDISQRTEVSPVCPEEKSNTTCVSPNGILPGVTRFVFSTTVSLPAAPNWRLAFAGEMNNNSLAGRSRSITNITLGGGGGQLMYLEAFLNNEEGPNSSPQYTSIPTPFYCINQAQQYNQGAVDADADSLYFSLIPALISSTASTVYIAPASGTAPLTTAPNTFNYNSLSGQMSFTPNAVQHSLVVNKVEEYKNGKLVGSSMREMTFIVLDDCDNSAPLGYVDSVVITGGATRNNFINVCANTPDLEFTIPAIDADDNNIEVTLNNVPDGATVIIKDNNTSKPVVDFKWDTKDVPLGVYNLFITYKDDACPLYSSQTIAYTIRVVNEIEVNHEVIKPTNCYNLQHIQFDIQYGIPPRKVLIKHNNGTIVGDYIDSTGVITDSFKSGKYTLYAESEVLKCKAQYDFTVEHSGIYPLPPYSEDINQCLYDEPVELTVKPADVASEITWYSTELTKLTEAPTYTTDIPGKLTWYATQTVNVCESVRDTVNVTVHDFPSINIINRSDNICVGDGIQLQAVGGIKYEWGPEDQIEYYNDTAYTYVRQPTVYYVKGYSEYNCPNTDTIVYDKIEQCCTFSYPDAFTPNNDGINDGWHPLTYGNVDFYLLSVYDRWGRRVYISSDPRESWDGTFNGKASGLGTYHYYLRAVCVTGHEETTNGSFILLR